MAGLAYKRLQKDGHDPHSNRDDCCQRRSLAAATRGLDHAAGCGAGRVWRRRRFAHANTDAHPDAYSNPDTNTNPDADTYPHAHAHTCCTPEAERIVDAYRAGERHHLARYERRNLG